jgi:ELWxxDGT repeat protein
MQVKVMKPLSLATALAFAATLAVAVMPVAAATGPYLVKDIHTSGSSNPYYITDMNGIAYFSARGGGKGDELWRSDGTAKGTYRVKDIKKGPGNSWPYGFAALGGLLYFVADDGVHGVEPWVSDGTGPGTRLLKDLKPGSDSSAPLEFTQHNGAVYFAAGDFGNRNELWRTDGTTNGTNRLATLPTGPNGDIGTFRSFAGKLFFVVYNGDDTGALYKTDGTSTGTKPFRNSAGNPVTGEIANLSIVGSTLYFSRGRSDLGPYKGELWRTKGTASTTKKIANLAASLITDVGGTAFFRTYEATVETNFGHLWKTNGSAATTVLIRDFDNNGGLGWTMFLPVGGKLMFDASEDGSAEQLWTSDGTTAGTQPIGKQVSVDQGAVVLGSVVYFGGYSDEESGRCAFATNQYLWRSDGTADGTYDVEPSANYCPTNLAVVGDSIYFASTIGGYGDELWRYVP